MKNILIPTDFSNNSYNAMFYALNIFKDETCKFYILHSFEVKTNLFTSRLDTEKGKIQYEEQLAKVENQLIEVILNITSSSFRNEKHSYETLAITKPIEETIPKTIKNKNIDLVVMGTKGATGAKEILFGSNAIKIAKLLHNTPLLLIPKETHNATLDNIVFATAFKNGYTNESLTTLKSFCNLSNATLKIVSILDTKELSENQEKNKEVLEENITEIPYDYSVVYKNKSVDKHIKEYVKNLDFDILSMIKYSHDDFYKFTHEATIDKLGYHIEKPFLIIPA